MVMPRQSNAPFELMMRNADASNRAAAQNNALAQSAMGQMFREQSRVRAQNQRQTFASGELDRRQENSQANIRLTQGLIGDRQETNANIRATGTQRRAFNKTAQKGLDFGANMALKLSEDMGLPLKYSAAFFGNFAHESGNFNVHQEIMTPARKRRGERGGIGWPQWTGIRRKQFEEFTAAAGGQVDAPESIYNFLIHELTNLPAGQKVIAMLQSSDYSVEEAAKLIQDHYEIPADKVGSLQKRISNSQNILAKMNQYANIRLGKPDTSADVPARVFKDAEGKEYDITNLESMKQAPDEPE